MKLIVPALAGGLSFVLMFMIFKLSFFISIPAAIAVYIIIKLIMSRKKKEVEEIDIQVGLSPSKVREIVYQGHRKVSSLRSTVNIIRNKEVRLKGLEICKLADAIFDDFKEDPKDIKSARKFINYYLDATISIITKYKNLHNSKVDSEEARNAIEKSEETLDTIKAAFEKQLQKLLENDVMDLDTEIELLQKTLKMENMGK